MEAIERRPTTPIKPVWLVLLSVAIGAAAGCGALIFRALIAFIHNLLLVGRISLSYHATQHTPPSRWGPLVMLAPVVAAAAGAILVKRFAPEAGGRGISEVMDAIYYQGGRIRPVVALIKALATSLTLGSGGSAGREGPIIQIGASFGSTAGQLFRVPAWQRDALIAAGASAGIAATFNTPVGGLLFVLETILSEFSVRTLAPMALATVTATFVGRLFFGTAPPFVIQVTGPSITAGALAAYAVLGLLMGLASLLFIKSIFTCERLFEQRAGGNHLWRHMAGMFGVGVIFYGTLLGTGRYYVEGVGYATIHDILTAAGLPLALLLALFVLKLAATSLTLGSGASGGVFSPALFLGATLGGAYGIILGRLVPHCGASPEDFAAAGMAGIVGGATGAALAAIVMVFEMTRDYNLLLPMLLTVAISYGMRKKFCRDSIYTLKLATQGHFIRDSLWNNPWYSPRAGELAGGGFTRVEAGENSATLVQTAEKKSLPPVFMVTQNGQIIGFIRRESLFQDTAARAPSRTCGDLADKTFLIVKQDALGPDVIEQFRANPAAGVAVVTESATPAADRATGIILREQLTGALWDNANRDVH